MRYASWILLAAMLGGCQSVRQPLEVMGGNTAARAVKRMEDPIFPDERREGILYLVDHEYGRKAPYTERYRQIAVSDSDYTVRAMAIRALNISRDSGATAIFIQGLSDTQPLVRLEAAKALVNLPDANAIPKLLQVVSNEDENKDVRIAAADALRHYKSLEVARTLVGVLQQREFGVAWQARKSLVQLTGHDLGYNDGAWLNYLTGPDKPFA
ncbi:MAG: HEAT repeat domain-containing protein [Phycisphaerales bacterium]|nr:HEAT repeat domain-containing protein [Phycisphaerales bacterium]